MAWWDATEQAKAVSNARRGLMDDALRSAEALKLWPRQAAVKSRVLAQHDGWLIEDCPPSTTSCPSPSIDPWPAG